MLKCETRMLIFGEVLTAYNPSRPALYYSRNVKHHGLTSIVEINFASVSHFDFRIHGCCSSHLKKGVQKRNTEKIN